MGEIKWIGSLSLVILFSMAIVGYTVNFGGDNPDGLQLTDDPYWSEYQTNATATFSNFTGDVDSSSQAFFPSKVEGAEQTVVSGGEFKVTISSLAGGMGNVFSTIKRMIFGGDSGLGIFLGALVSFIIFVSIRYAWKSWKGGNPD